MITIIAKRWFQKSYGNTYHSVRVLKDGEEIGHAPFSYGYDEQYLQTAHEILKARDLAPEDYHEFRRATRDAARFTVVCVDVDREKDL